MFKHILVAIVLVIACSAITFSQDTPKKEKQTVKKVECDPACGFAVRSHDDKELADIVMTHAKKSHNMKLTEKEVKDMAKTEEIEIKKEMKKEPEKKDKQ